MPHPDKVSEIARDWFPALGTQVLLNHASYGLIPTPVVEAMTSHLRSQSERPWSQWPRALAAPALERLERRMGVPSDTLSFVHTTTAGLIHLASLLPSRRSDVVLVPDNEYPSTPLPWLARQRAGDITVRFLRAHPFPTGGVSLDAISEALRDPNVRVLTLSAVNWLGYRYPLDDIAALCDQHDVILSIDGTQAMGMVETLLPRANKLFFSGAFYKWGFAPEGIAIVHCSPALRALMRPAEIELKCFSLDEARLLDYEVRHPQLPLLTGPAPVCYIGLRCALDLQFSLGLQAIEARALGLARQAAGRLQVAGFVPLGATAPENGSGILVFSHPDPAKNARIKEELAAANVFVDLREKRIRLAFHVYNNESDLDRLLEALARLI
jgi:cysteine desulfurase / selenocysteine lyase